MVPECIEGIVYRKLIPFGTVSKGVLPYSTPNSAKGIHKLLLERPELTGTDIYTLTRQGPNGFPRGGESARNESLTN